MTLVAVPHIGLVDSGRCSTVENTVCPSPPVLVASLRTNAILRFCVLRGCPVAEFVNDATPAVFQ